MKTVKYLLVILAVVGLSGILSGGACDDASEALCGPCGTIESGDTTISGSAELDGIFKAVGTLDTATKSIKGDFDARVQKVAEEVFEIEVEEPDAGVKTTEELVDEIETQFEAQIASKLETNVTVKYQPPKCEANVDVSVQAQAQCEAKVDASCSAEVECDPGKLSFSCEGTCQGSCQGTCEVPTCTVTGSAAASCEGTCEGSCTVTADGSASCSGKCEGTCSGECSAYNSGGDCAGSCSGTCNGTCQVSGEAAADCSGTCSGSCTAEVTAEATCEGTAGCRGSCEGECSGSCQGEISAPKCEGQASCEGEASAKCEAQASAQASANLKCTPPSLELDYSIDTSVVTTPEDRALLEAKIDKFVNEMISIVQGSAKLRGLVDPAYAEEIGMDQTPVEAIGLAVADFTADLVSGDIEIPAAGLLNCTLDAFEDSAVVLSNVTTEMSGTVQAQLDLMALIGI